MVNGQFGLPTGAGGSPITKEPSTSISQTDRQVVESLFRAMQAGPQGEQAIRESFQQMWQNPAPDRKLVLDRVDLDGDDLMAEWTCISPVFPEPMQGHDLFTLRGEKMVRLEIVVTSMPPMGS